ncbi:hypothetical protein DC094_15440 [Pelagibaculum spongiae]|uniref:Uncharacterized protein n=1 Tax=Pelagibaculum spongiae TaxID=2080658 RepID=A0A2V1GTS7_9GAMM|nr:hypothetical protein DC094_15440 [Pelagibaculum spongiae]
MDFRSFQHFSITAAVWRCQSAAFMFCRKIIYMLIRHFYIVVMFLNEFSSPMKNNVSVNMTHYQKNYIACIN